jgi:hypothetical protein
MSGSASDPGPSEPAVRARRSLPRLFKHVMLQDKSYVDRLKRHYTMFKNLSRSPKRASAQKS